MEFRQLEAFAAIAKYKSFSKAAESLFLSQPTVSSHLGSLERDLQKKLVIRTTKNLKLTEEGERFLKYVQRILELKEAALRDLSGDVRDIVTLGASTIPSGYLLPDVLTEFRRENPGIYFQIRQGDSQEIEERVLDGTVELGLTGSICEDRHCVCEKFCSDRMVIAMPSTSEYFALQKEVEKQHNLEKIFSKPIIMREIGSGTRKAAEQFLKHQNIREENLHVVARVNDLESIKRMIAGGMGISIMSGFAVEDMIKSGQILVCELDTEIHRDFYLVRRKNMEVKPAVEKFIHFVLDYYRKGGKR